MDPRWVNNETSCCWPGYEAARVNITRKSVKQKKKKFTQIVLLLAVSVQQRLTRGHLGPITVLAFYLSMSDSFFPSANTRSVQGGGGGGGEGGGEGVSKHEVNAPVFSPCPRAPLSCLSLSPSFSRKIQYLSESVWVHSPLSLGELPPARRWISRGLIDITLVMKYAYHDQRWWWERRRHLCHSSSSSSSSQPGVDAFLENPSVAADHRVQSCNKCLQSSLILLQFIACIVCIEPIYNNNNKSVSL